MKIYVLVTHLYEDFELIGAFTDEAKFVEAYEKLDEQNDLDDRGDIFAYEVDSGKSYGEMPPEIWVYNGEIERHKGGR